MIPLMNRLLAVFVKNPTLMTKPHCLHPTLISQSEEIGQLKRAVLEWRCVHTVHSVIEEKIKDRCVNQRGLMA